MKCPNCNTLLLGSAFENNVCNNCNYIFPEEMQAKFSFYNELKIRLNNLNNIQKSFSEELEILNQQTAQFEQIINAELEKIPTGTKKFAKLTKPANAGNDLLLNTSQSEPVAPSDQNYSEKPAKQIPIKNPVNWEMLFGFNGFLILGVISIIVGVAFFIRKAFVSGLLGPVGKVSIIYLGAIASLAVGNFFRKKNNTDFGLALVGLGIALLYYSTYAGFQTYQVFNQFIAFFLMVLITTFAVFLAVVDNNKWFAVLGLIGGFSTPLLLSTGAENNLTLFSYISILNFGLLAIAAYKRWNLLNNLGFIFTYLIFSVTFKTEQYWLSTIFLNLFFFIYSLVPFAYHILRKDSEKVSNTWLIFINSFIALGINYELITKNNFSIEMLSVITLLYALNFTLMAAYLLKKGKQSDQSFIFVIAKASLFLIITIPIIFSREVITIFWFTEAVILLWISIRLHGKKLIYGAYFVLFLAINKFFIVDYNNVFNLVDYFYFKPSYSYLIFARYVTSIFLIVSFYKFITMLNKVPVDFGPDHKTFFKIFSISWIVSLFIILNVETSGFFYDYFSEARFVAISILWALFAITLMFQGLRKNNSLVRKLSIGLFFAALAKVFFLDIAKMGASYKFVSFIVLGLVLILASYLYRRFKDELIDTMAENLAPVSNVNHFNPVLPGPLPDTNINTADTTNIENKLNGPEQDDKN